MALEHLLINHFKNFDTTFMGKIKNCQNITFFLIIKKKKNPKSILLRYLLAFPNFKKTCETCLKSDLENLLLADKL